MSASLALPPWRRDVSAAEMIGWVEALRDDNPIHRDPAAAETLGFGPHTVNPGPTNLAYVLNMVASALPDEHPARISARFLGNVLSGDEVEVVGTQDGSGGVNAQLRVPARDETALEVDVVLGRLP